MSTNKNINEFFQIFFTGFGARKCLTRNPHELRQIGGYPAEVRVGRPGDPVRDEGPGHLKEVGGHGHDAGGVGRVAAGPVVAKGVVHVKTEGWKI